MTIQSDSDGQHGRGVKVDWDVALQEHQRWLRTIVYARLQDRELLLLKYTEEWRYQQIAEHLGITETAVEARLHRARKRLRQELTVEEIVSTNR